MDGEVINNKQLQNQKLESLGLLAGGVAHDFNNILSIIDGYARIARKESSGNVSVMEYLDRVAEAVKRGAGLTKKLLMFGRHNIAVVGPHDVGQLVEDMEVLLRPLFDATYTVNIWAEKNVYVDTSPDWMSQILMNLCVNARDAMANGGVIDISVTCAKSFVCLSVRDYGAGIDDDVRARMFDPFFTTKERGKGTGLGLSTVYGLVLQMKGSIEVESTIGRGTVFHIYLPLSAKMSKRTLPTDMMDIKNMRFDGYVALIAEDEPDLRLLMQHMLEETGMTVYTASNGAEALVIQEDIEEDIDFLLTDVVMPQMNGVDMARLFSSLRPNTHIVFMSGYPAGGKMARVDIPDGAILLPKPVSEETLKTLLYRLIVPDVGEPVSPLTRMAGSWHGMGG